MHRRRRSLVIALMALTLPAMQSAAAAAPAPDSPNEKDKNRVLHQLDVAAASFRTVSADFVFDTEQVDPVPDTDIQKGTVYYERKGSSFSMAAHISQVNKRVLTRVYGFFGGAFKLYDKVTNQVTRFSKAGKFESYIMLGFGASGKDLEQKWNIRYLGSETIDGIKTEKLELVAKDEEVRKVITKVTIWIDPERAVSLKQRFDEGPDTYRICTYSHFKLNQPLPADAFKLSTDSQTQFVDR